MRDYAVRYTLPDESNGLVVFHHSTGLTSFSPVSSLCCTAAEVILGPHWWPTCPALAVAAVVARDEALERWPVLAIREE